ncbi:MAG: 1-hydroxycarotenoid 3,4-desaturase CrtD [Bacteroidota bacterium]
MSQDVCSKRKAIVIGAGIAGLASAIRLALKGFEVTIFEKNLYPGGKLSGLQQDGFCFDAGPSLFTQPSHIEDLFALANEPIEEYFQYSQVPVSCHYFFENGKGIEASTDVNQFATNMQTAFGEPAENIIKYLQRSASIYNNIGELFIMNSLHRPGTFLNTKTLRAVGASRYNYLFQSLDQYNQSAFKTEEAVQIFNRYATYNGSNPYKAPAMLSVIPHLEMNEGVYYPKGGMISITNALYKLAIKKGVIFHFDSHVTQIIHHQNKASGIVTNEKQVYADVIVSNCDVYFTYKHLLGNEPGATKILKQERSSSALVFYWGIGESFKQLGLHNILFSKAYRSEFENLFEKKTMHDDPTVYINITSKMETGMAPAGQENWFVMVNAPANYGQDWTALQSQARQHIIDKINRMLHTDIEPLIRTEALLDPRSIESRTASFMGSLYGTSSNSKMAAFLRHPNFTSKIKGLYFVGGSVHPGGGIPLCLNSAKIMSEMLPPSR